MFSTTRLIHASQNTTLLSEQAFATLRVMRFRALALSFVLVIHLYERTVLAIFKRGNGELHIAISDTAKD